MMKNKKGFTLIELLAVITILAVVTTIAVTAVVPRMKKAKKNAFLDEAKIYLKTSDEIDLFNNKTTKCLSISEINEQYISKSDSNYTGTLFVYPDGSTFLSLTDGKYYVAVSKEPNLDEITEIKPANFIDSCNSSTSTYHIVYNSNGGSGASTTQLATSGSAVTIKESPFTKANRVFAKWNTMPDGSGQDYYAGQTVSNIASSGTVNLYAQWAIEKYEYLPEYTFTGSNNLNSNINLFSVDNFYRNFEISFDIVSRSSFSSYDTYMNAMDESANPYSGVLYRRSSATVDNLAANANIDTKYSKTYTASSITSVKIIRRDKKLYSSINGAAYSMILDISALNNTFDVPVTFGSSYKNNAPFRYFKGTLKNMRVYLME